MGSAFKAAARQDDVDRIVDTLLAEPARADDIKTLLRHRLGMDRVVHLKSAVNASDDLDDMWDNVPV